MVGNGTIGYDHERDGRPTELGGCNGMVRNLKHDTFIFIRYVRRRLTVRSAGEAPGERVCFAVARVRGLLNNFRCYCFSTGHDRYRWSA